ncbi:cell division protein FtsL [Aquabacter spiritensis]|uniref:Cell division protein FtsL n=1 Tax=Aquabacter spiritensis TaxID=933073 RepID=A0A4R3M1T9_9HYPH|nr:hypothetical protein [Aquabacter spiritensis]TCT06646.1 hypothetical protein EDC64_102125 [Aquabacter spiritensis]
MFRIANLVMVVALLVTAAAVYQVKYASTADAERLAHLRQSIRAERDAIAVMRAEWARRTSPLYIQGLVQRHLDLQVLGTDAMSMLDDLPEKPAGGSDGIGGMIEALSDAPLVTSSIGKPDRPPAASASPSAAANGGAAILPATSALRPASAPVSTPKPPPAAGTALPPRPAAAAAAPRSVPPPAVSAPPVAAAPPSAAATPVEGLLRGIGSFFGPVVPSSGQ